jgi:hypothetical protein
MLDHDQERIAMGMSEDVQRRLKASKAAKKEVA